MSAAIMRLMAKRLREWSRESLSAGTRQVDLRDAVVALADELADVEDRLFKEGSQ